MKTDKYTGQLEAVIRQAKTSWDFERMREALARGKALNEALAYKQKQEAFKLQMGGR